MKLKNLQRQGKGRTQSFSYVIQFMRYNMRKLTACALQRKGIPRQLARGGKFWQSTVVRIHSLPLCLMNNKLNNKKNELWKMKLSK